MGLLVNENVLEIYENLKKIDIRKIGPTEKVFCISLSYEQYLKKADSLDFMISTDTRVLQHHDEEIIIDGKITSIREYRKNILKNVNKDYNFDILLFTGYHIIINYPKDFEKNFEKTEFYFLPKKDTFSILNIEHTLKEHSHILPLSICYNYHEYLKDGGILDSQYRMKTSQNKKYYYIMKSGLLFTFSYQLKVNDPKFMLENIYRIQNNTV